MPTMSVFLVKKTTGKLHFLTLGILEIKKSYTNLLQICGILGFTSTFGLRWYEMQSRCKCATILYGRLYMNALVLLFTYFPKLLKLRFLTQYIHHFQRSNRIRTVFC